MEAARSRASSRGSGAPIPVSMFVQLSHPLSLTAERLCGIRFSLNTPILEAGQLPAGPACAAIVVHREESGRRAITIGIRSLRTSDVTLFRFDDDLESEAGLFTATESALTFCEGMGFVFDDDELERSGPEGCAAALIRWQELAGPEAGAAPAERPGELLLEDELDCLPLPHAGRGDARDASAGPRAAATPLSKFRSGGGAAAPSGRGDKRGAALGRIPLLKRRRGSAAERLGFLLRILGSF